MSRYIELNSINQRDASVKNHFSVDSARLALTALVTCSVCSAHAADSISTTPGPTAFAALTGSLQLDPLFAAPQGNYQGYNTAGNLAYLKAVTATSTIAGGASIHAPELITDGNYGNGRSWIGAGSENFVTIDLGLPTSFDTVVFGRDRLGGYDERDPGQVQILGSNDGAGFQVIFDSAIVGGFSGAINGSQSIIATLDPETYRYVRFSAASGTAAIDEIAIYNTSAVPEPSSWALLLAGLSWGVAASIKRRLGARMA